MKHKKLIGSILIFLLIFIIYILCANKKITYIALGDSVAIGQNPYGKISFGYTDYVANYLDRNNMLKYYTKDYSVSGYRSNDLLQDIKDNKELEINNKKIRLKSILRESNLVTLSIGANDFLEKLKITDIKNINLDYETLIALSADVFPKVDELVKELIKYAKGDIIIVGYYNPLPRLNLITPTQMDKLFDNVDAGYKDICNKYDIYYISMYNEFKNNDDYLPNPFDIHPNNDGYQAISNKVIDLLEKNLQK